MKSLQEQAFTAGERQLSSTDEVSVLDVDQLDAGGAFRIDIAGIRAVEVDWVLKVSGF